MVCTCEVSNAHNVSVSCVSVLAAAVSAARVDGVFSNSDFALVGFPCVAAGLAVARVFFFRCVVVVVRDGCWDGWYLCVVVVAVHSVVFIIVVW